MQIQIKISNIGNFGYTMIFVVLTILMFVFIRIMFLRKPAVVEDEDESDEDDSDDEFYEKKKKKKTYTSQDFLSEKEGKRILVLFASQTGTAREFSETFEEEARKYGFKSFAAPINDYQRYWPVVKEGKIDVLCLILATYGEGEPTDSGKPFHNFLEHTKDDFSSIKYVCFGLGNSQYTVRCYQAFSRSTVKLLNSRGSKLLGEFGEGDSDQYIEDDFDDWRMQILDFLSEKFGTPKQMDLLQENLDLVEPKYEIKWITEREEEVEGEEEDEETMKRRHLSPKESVPAPFSTPRVAPSQKAPFPSPIISRNELLRDDPENSTLELILDMTGSRIKYFPGDHLGIWPQNDSAMVYELANRLNVLGDLHRCLSLIKKSNPIMGNRYFQKTSLFNILTYYCDITNSPTRKQMRLLYRYTTDEKEKENVLKLVSDNEENSRILFRETVLDKSLNWLEVLDMFPSCTLPLDVFLEACQIQKPRYYSIATTQRIGGQYMKMVLAIHKFKARDGTVREGVTSKFLKNVPLFGGCLSKEEYDEKREEAEKKKRAPRRFRKKPLFNLSSCVYLWVRESLFRLPPENELSLGCPVIMISNGTGLAPFLGFLEEMECIGLGDEENGQVMLYFGCRNREKDFIYKDKIMEWKSKGIINDLGLAFSRDQEEKMYVQHVLLRNKDELVKAIQRGGYVYICGSSAMAKEVNESLIKVLKEEVPRLRNLPDDDILQRLRIEAWNL